MLGQNLREAIANLLGAKQRTALALIGIVIGTGSVIAMINIATIVKAEALRQFKDMGTDILTIQPPYSESDAAGIGPEDVPGLLREATGLVSVAAHRLRRRHLVVPGPYRQRRFARDQRRARRSRQAPARGGSLHLGRMTAISTFA